MLEARVRSRVVVTTASGLSFRGVLAEMDDRALVLRETLAVGVGQSQGDIPVDGELLLLWADVAYVQRP